MENVNPVFQYEVNKRKVWNIALDLKNDKNDPDRQGQVIVENATSATNQPKATDVDIEKGRIVALADQWESSGLLYNSLFTKQNTTVVISTTNPDRINRKVRCILSGNAMIRDDEVQIDRNIAIADISIIS